MAYSGVFRMNRAEKQPDEQEHIVPRSERTPQKQDKLSGAVEALMKKLDPSRMETDDLIMALILYLMYRESGDKDLLIMLGAMFLS